jgi:hypothetical protein
MSNKKADKRPDEPLVVVGFGKADLADLLGEDHIERLTEAFQKQWPPRYRRASLCTADEIELFKELTAILSKAVAK